MTSQVSVTVAAVSAAGQVSTLTTTDSKKIVIGKLFIILHLIIIQHQHNNLDNLDVSWITTVSDSQQDFQL